MELLIVVGTLALFIAIYFRGYYKAKLDCLNEISEKRIEQYIENERLSIHDATIVYKTAKQMLDWMFEEKR